MKTNSTAMGALDSEETVPINLYNAEGKLMRTIRLKPEYATKVINFIGIRYERIPDNAETNVKDAWIEAGEHPESAPSGIAD